MVKAIPKETVLLSENLTEWCNKNNNSIKNKYFVASKSIQLYYTNAFGTKWNPATIICYNNIAFVCMTFNEYIVCETWDDFINTINKIAEHPVYNTIPLAQIDKE